MLLDRMPATAGTAVGRRNDRLFYTGMSIAAVLAVFWGFAPTYFLRLHYQSTPLPTYLHVHGFLFSAWIVFFVAQTTLVAARRTDVHRQLGWVGAGLAVLMVVAAITAGILSGRRNVAAGHVDEALTFLTVPVFSMLVFLLLVAAAVYYRRRPETHKRLMLLATVSILDAAIARWPTQLVATNLGDYGLTDMFIVAAVLYDVASRRRVHGVYIWGGLVIVVFQFLRDVVGRTAVWHAIARALLQQA